MAADRVILESELLAVRWQRGDRSAFEEIVKLWERPLFYYLRRLSLTEADAWELLQETWLKVLRSLKSLREPRTLPAFLYTTARNTAINRFRSREPEEKVTDSSQNGDAALAIDEIACFDNAEQVHQALDQLPLPQREVLTLYFLEDLSIDDIAQVLNVPVGTVKSRLHYAKATMHKILTRGDHHAK